MNKIIVLSAIIFLFLIIAVYIGLSLYITNLAFQVKINLPETNPEEYNIEFEEIEFFSNEKEEITKEIRKRLDLANYKHVDIMVGDNLTPTDIDEFVKAEAPVSLFAVGAYVASAPSNPYSFDIKEIDGSPISRRGNVPGMNAVPRLNRMI